MKYGEWLDKFNETLKMYCPYFEKLGGTNHCLIYLYINNVSPDVAFSLWYNGIPMNYQF